MKNTTPARRQRPWSVFKRATRTLVMTGTLVTLTPVFAHAQESPPSSPAPVWSVGGLVQVSSPVVPSAMFQRGVGIHVARLLARGPWFTEGRITMAKSNAYREDFELSYYDARATLGLGAETRIGALCLFTSIHAGGRYAYEEQKRQAARRLEAAGIDPKTQVGSRLTPVIESWVGVGTRFYEGFALRLAAGPSLGLATWAKAPRNTVTFGVSASGGITYEW